MRKTFTYNGRRYYITANSESELSEKIREKKKKLIQPYNYTVKDWSDVYLQTYKADIDKNTMYNYVLRFNKYILPAIGKLQLKNVTQIDCQRILNSVKHLSNNYIHKIYNDLNQLFNAAVGNGLMLYNPMLGVIVPRGYTGTHRPINESERKIVLSTISSDLNISGIYVALMLFCGCRPNEAGIIKNTDISGNALHIRGDKTIQSDRYVPVPDYVLSLFNKLNNRKYLVESISGIAPVKKHHRVKLWNRFKKLSGLDDDITPYSFRHTYCTDLRDAGVEIVTAKELMGHSTIRLTADVYTHKNIRSFDDSAEKIAARLKSHIL